MNEIEVLKKWIKCRSFELACAEAFRRKKIPSPIYLSLGTEHIPVLLSEVFPTFKVFAQHRCHSYFLSFGGRPEDLKKMILGKQGSASINLPNMFGHSGLLGDQVPIAVGYADASQEPVICIMGDAAAEEDYVLGALGYAITHKSPVLFVCEDNNLSILTEKKVRRSWNLVDVAKGFGISSIEIEGDPYLIDNELKLIKFLNDREKSLPTLLNILVEREIWHAGAGSDGEPKICRYEEFKKHLLKQNLIEEKALQQQEYVALKEMWNLWEL